MSRYRLFRDVASLWILLFFLGHFRRKVRFDFASISADTMAPLRNLLLSFAFTWARAAVTPLDSSVQVRNAPGHSVEDTYHAIKRGLALASLEKRDSFKAEPMNIARSWSGATLLSV